MSSRPKIKFSGVIKKPELMASLLLVVAFFLPWFNNPVMTAAGYQISRILVFFSIPQPVFSFLFLLTLLIPLAGATIFILSILNKPVALLCMITGMIPFIIAIILYFKINLVVNQMAAGIILTLMAAVALLVIGANKQYS